MIYDARPKLNAQANMAKSGGYESVGQDKHYKNCQIEFCNIDNIHSVRNAYNSMLQLVHPPIGTKQD